jgi:hypothetical protein
LSASLIDWLFSFDLFLHENIKEHTKTRIEIFNFINFILLKIVLQQK